MTVLCIPTAEELGYTGGSEADLLEKVQKETLSRDKFRVFKYTNIVTRLSRSCDRTDDV